jgi:hypothetical protein
MRKLGWVIAVALPLSGQPLLAATGSQQGQDQQQQQQGGGQMQGEPSQQQQGGQAQEKQGDQSKEAKGGQKESVTMDQLPAAVQSTFRSEAKGAQVEELYKETKKGKTVYEGEIMKNGKATELKVSEDGKVLHKGKAHSEKGESEHQQQ